MTKKILIPLSGAADAIARLFMEPGECSVSVREDRAFASGRYLSLGQIKIADAEERRELGKIAKAARAGEFEWRTPDIETLTGELSNSLAAPGGKSAASQPSAQAKIRRIVDALGAIAVRLGLANPIFDPGAVEFMPFRRPTTVVSDTSGVIQGGLSFVAANLHPTARIKIPAIVQMEIVNFADRFLKNWRAIETKVRPIDLLFDHINSQAGQRVLLQLELHSDIEIERTFLFGDPLRQAFQQERDKELQELNLSVAISAYSDRLILEAARQHQSQANHGHRVTLLTSDQGLARMALAEGFEPLYFHSSKPELLLGRTLTGVNFHPFTGALRVQSLQAVLWELATIFGTARLQNLETQSAIEIHAIGSDLAWAPYHSRDDLLWIEELPGSTKDGPELQSGRTAERPTVEPAASEKSKDKEISNNNGPTKNGPSGKAHRYKMSIDSLLRLVDALDIQQTLKESEALEILDVNTPAAARDYRRFLLSGNAIVIEGANWRATETTKVLSVAIRNGKVADIRSIMRSFPSYAEVESALRSQPIGKPMSLDSFGRATATYLALAEITELGAPIYGEGFFPTPTEPSAAAFAQIAISEYEKLKSEGGWAETGAWLESLLRNEGIHPLVARNMLQTASERGFLSRATEGSTTDIKRDRHTVRVLDVKDGVPRMKIEHLYRGDFLIPGKGSSSIRIGRITQ